MTYEQHRKEMTAILNDLRRLRNLLNSEDKMDGVSGLWLSHRVERTNDFLETLIDDLEVTSEGI